LNAELHFGNDDLVATEEFLVRNYAKMSIGTEPLNRVSVCPGHVAFEPVIAVKAPGLQHDSAYR
jgi:hypothetical protein